MNTFSMEKEEQKKSVVVEPLEFHNQSEEDILNMVERIILEGIPTPQSQVRLAENLSLAARIEHHVNQQLNPTSRQRITRIFRLLRQHNNSPTFVNQDDPVIPEVSLRELDILVGPQNNRAHSIARRIKDTILEIGYVTLCRHLVQIKTPENLRTLQGIVRDLNPQAFSAVRQSLQTVASVEDCFLSFWVSTEQGMRDILADVLTDQEFKSLHGLNDWANSNSIVIEFQQLFRFVSPIFGPSMSLITLGVGIATLNPVVIMSGAFFTAVNGAQVMKNIEQLQYSAKVLYLMQKKLIALAKFVEELEKLQQQLKQLNVSENLTSLLSLPIEINEINKIRTLLSTDTFKGLPSFFSHWGKICLAYRLMIAKKDEFIRAYAALGTIDFIAATATLSSPTRNSPYCTAQYTDAGNVALSITDGWSPLIDPATVITNNVSLGGNNPPNVIITGPNARGKTTILRMVAAAALLASTLGYAPASNIVIPANLNFLTSINIADNPSEDESLFVAAVKRMASILLTIQNQHARPCLIVTDEPFVGTRRENAEALAFQTLTTMGQEPNAIMLITSHLNTVTRLETDRPDRFRNYHVATGYRLTPGIDNNLEQYDADALQIVRSIFGNESFANGFEQNLADLRNQVINARNGSIRRNVLPQE